MKIITFLVISLFFVILLNGCTYLSHRGRDAMDIATFTVGGGLGAKARVGPLGLGLGFYSEGHGIRNGVMIDGSLNTFNVMTLLGELETIPLPENNHPNINYEYANYRNKTFKADLESGIISMPNHRNCYHYYSQVEIFLGAFLGVRAGLNPGEFLDFMLGWFKIDIYKDDISKNEFIKIKEQQDKKKEVEI